MKTVFLYILALCLASAGSAAQSDDPARAQLERFSSELETLRASFEQQVISSEGLIEDQSSGRVWLMRPQMFRWQYGGDFPELIVADGSHVWIYDETLEQVTVKEQSGMASNSPLTLLTDISGLDEQFEVRELGESAGMKLLELRALDSESEFERVLLGLQADMLLMMTMEDVFGFRTEIRFSQVERNPELDPELFRFEPPESADLIGDLP